MHSTREIITESESRPVERATNRLVACGRHGQAGAARRGARRPRVTVIEPQRGWVSIGFSELWQYRELLFQFVWRDFSAKYRQSVLGMGWAIFTPVITMIVFTIVFAKILGLSSGTSGVPYPIFNYTALLPWLYFSTCLASSSTSTVGRGSLITKVYFPRLLLPLSKVAGGLIDFGIRFVLLLLLMVLYQVTPSWNMLFVPLFLLMSILAALSVGLWATALAVKYRDIQHVIQFVVQLWMWVTPVAYSVEKVPENWQVVYWLNPMVGVIEGFRWALLGSAAPDWTMMAVSSGVAVAFLAGGLYYFRRTEATFADII